MIQMLDRRQLFVRQNGVRHGQAVAMLRTGIEQVPLGSDEALQRHHDFFADRIDRRIRDLGEQLLEVVVQHSRLIRQTGECRVVAHRAERILLRLDQRDQHEMHGLGRVAEGLHLPEQEIARHAISVLGLAVRRLVALDDFIERKSLLFEPLLVRPAASDVALQFFVIDNASLGKIDEKHLAGCRRPLSFTLAGSMSSTPTSLAMMTRSSWVT